jgi:predicted O-methyltransferase YrrM
MNIDLRYSYIIEKSLSEYNQGHYYVILAHLSTYFNDSVIVDLGTHRGESAAALAYNKSNKIYTYDIAHSAQAVDRFKKEEFQNIKYILGNCIEDNWSGMAMLEGDPPKSDKEIFLSSELIFMDIDPHDGIQEDRVLNFLISNNWKGIMVCDDIGMGREPGKENAHPQMRDWWYTINLPKYDISKNYYAAGTGTGIIAFGGQEVLF